MLGVLTAAWAPRRDTGSRPLPALRAPFSEGAKPLPAHPGGPAGRPRIERRSLGSAAQVWPRSRPETLSDEGVVAQAGATGLLGSVWRSASLSGWASPSACWSA